VRVSGLRVFRYAYSQARVRARLAAIVSPRQWAYFAEAADLNNLIERMRANGLGFWLDEMARGPAPAAIERQFRRRARLFVQRLLPVFPRNWHAAVRWLSVLPDLGGVRLLLREEECAQLLDEGSLLRAVAEHPHLERRALLAVSEYRPLLGGDPIESLWYAEFVSRWPRGDRREAAMQSRFDRILRNHAAAVLGLRSEFRRRDPAAAVDMQPAAAQWRLREALAQQVRALLAAGDPFHGAFILGYALLEALQAEKARALLLAYAHDWRASAQVGEVA
jgi:hypothetical protein